MDQKNKTIADYNQAFATVAEQQLLIFKQEEAINKIYAATATELADDEMQTLHQFSTRVFQDMARFGFWLLYSRVRAYNCISFKLSHEHEYMAELHSVLQPDVHRKSKTTVALTLSADNPKLQFLFDRLRTIPPYPHTDPSLINDYDRAFELGINHDFFFENSDDFKDKSAYDLRMYAIGVYLHGATLIPNSNNPPSNNSQPPPSANKEGFSVHIKSHGTFRYRYPDEADNTKWVSQRFEFAPSKEPFEYYHDTEKNTYAPKSTLFLSEQLALQISDDVGNLHEPLPLQSPLGVWSIIPVANVDTRKATKVIVEFELSYRVR
ncbi:hypothetical protein MN608_08667 [Microdochium nivale]|nr:hypothetical protein MN608_08667 [Microdochium nivale]